MPPSKKNINLLTWQLIFSFLTNKTSLPKRSQTKKKLGSLIHFPPPFFLFPNLYFFSPKPQQPTQLTKNKNKPKKQPPYPKPENRNREKRRKIKQIKEKTLTIPRRICPPMVPRAMAWLSGSAKVSHFRANKSSPLPLGILCFETGKAMSRLISLYRSLSDFEFSNLRKGPMRTQGIVFLNSEDERFLLGLACAEKLEELNRAVNTVTRLGQKCTDSGLDRFDRVYAEMNMGIVDLGRMEFASRNVEKLVEKMEKYVKATSNLHSSMGSLNELDISERKLKQWHRNLGPKLANRTNIEYFKDKIAFQRKQVRHFKDISLWHLTFDLSVGIMARIICIVYARICVLFGPFVSDLPRLFKNVKPVLNQKFTPKRIHPESHCCTLFHDRSRAPKFSSKSGPILKPSRKLGVKRTPKSGPLRPKSDGSTVSGNRNPAEVRKRKRVLQLPAESTVGGAGLAIRYANIIIQAERYLHAPTSINDEARGYLYELLPDNLKATVREKLWSHWCRKTEEESDGHSLAQGWRDALEELMSWLAPIAHDTVKWQLERNLEKQKFDAKPTVLLLQTLYFSDLEKTEAAIVEVLVGLSCIYRFENKRIGGRRGSSVGGCR